jgi:hypothetical protein
MAPTVLEQKPVGKKYENKDESVLVVEVLSQFWVTLYGGLTITTRATLYDRTGYKRSGAKIFWYRSRGCRGKEIAPGVFGRSAKLLIEENALCCGKDRARAGEGLEEFKDDTAGGDGPAGAGETDAR